MALLLLALAGCAVSADRRALPRQQPERPAPRPAKERPAWVARKVVPDAREINGVRTHIVKQGETGIAIARAYRIPWPDVVAANGLSPPYLLRVGDRLKLPGRQSARAMSVEQRARAFTIDMDALITGSAPADTAQAAPTAGTPPGTPVFRWPVDGRVISGFGPKAAGRFNDGVNLKVNNGTPVRAAADGTVAYAGDAIAGFGNLILVRHAGGWVTAYGHNEALLVARGQLVRAGDPIARAGATGAVTEPQLHFEIRRGRTAIDPQQLLPGR